MAPIKYYTLMYNAEVFKIFSIFSIVAQNTIQKQLKMPKIYSKKQFVFRNFLKVFSKLENKFKCIILTIKKVEKNSISLSLSK